jgi:hypothetical protein
LNVTFLEGIIVEIKTKGVKTLFSKRTPFATEPFKIRADVHEEPPTPVENEYLKR